MPEYEEVLGRAVTEPMPYTSTDLNQRRIIEALEDYYEANDDVMTQNDWDMLMNDALGG